MNKYPTKEEILEMPHLHKPEIISIFKEWKQRRYLGSRGMNFEDRSHAIGELLISFGAVYNKKPTVIFNPNEDSRVKNGTIYLKDTSIITALHEFAHFVFNTEDELKACRWSVWLFRKVFPKAFEKLVWKEHTLIRS